MSPDISRLLITLGLFSLTLACTFALVQLFFMLKDLRKTVYKLNKILDNAGTVSDLVVKPAFAISSLINRLKGSSHLLKKLFD